VFVGSDVSEMRFSSNMNQSLQLTGGFAQTNGNPDSYTISDLSRYYVQRYTEYAAVYHPNMIKLMIEYGPDAQNHFCYMWSLYFLDHYVSGTLDEIHGLTLLVDNDNIIPLSVIKPYIIKWLQFYRDDIIDKTTCEKGENYKFKKGFLYDFIMLHSPNVLFWSSTPKNGKKRDLYEPVISNQPYVSRNYSG
jgi:hypothetical protein